MFKLVQGTLVLLPTLNPIGCQKLKISHWNAKDIIQTTSALKLSEIKIGEKKINFKTVFPKRNQKLTYLVKNILLNNLPTIIVNVALLSLMIIKAALFEKAVPIATPQATSKSVGLLA